MAVLTGHLAEKIDLTLIWPDDMRSTGTKSSSQTGRRMEYDSEHKTPIVMDSAGTCFGNTGHRRKMYQGRSHLGQTVFSGLECLITILDEVEAVVKAVCAKCPEGRERQFQSSLIKLHRRWFMDVRHPMQTTRSVHNNLCIKLSFPKNPSFQVFHQIDQIPFRSVVPVTNTDRIMLNIPKESSLD
jgi:hypothetical protein